MFAKNDFVIDYDVHYYVGMSFSCAIIKSNEYLIEYILAVLNSTIAYNWFYTFGKKRGAGVDIGVDKLRSFPIKPCDMQKQLLIAEKVKLLLNDYEANIELDKVIDEEISKIYAEE